VVVIDRWLLFGGGRKLRFDCTGQIWKQCFLKEKQYILRSEKSNGNGNLLFFGTEEVLYGLSCNFQLVHAFPHYFTFWKILQFFDEIRSFKVQWQCNGVKSFTKSKWKCIFLGLPYIFQVNGIHKSFDLKHLILNDEICKLNHANLKI